MSMVTYQHFVYGLIKLGTGTNIDGQVHFISLTHQMKNVDFNIQGTAMRICVLQELSEISLLNFLITKREHLIVDII